MPHQSKSEELDQKELDDALVEYLQTDDYDFLASVTIQGVERILDKGASPDAVSREGYQSGSLKGESK